MCIRANTGVCVYGHVPSSQAFLKCPPPHPPLSLPLHSLHLLPSHNWPRSAKLRHTLAGESGKKKKRACAETHARKHTHNLCPLAGAKTVSAAILSGHEMTSIKGPTTLAVRLQEITTLADTQIQPYTKRPSRHRWTLLNSNPMKWLRTCMRGQLKALESSASNRIVDISGSLSALLSWTLLQSLCVPGFKPLKGPCKFGDSHGHRLKLIQLEM